VKIPASVQREIKRAVNLKAKAKAMEQEAKILTKEAKAVLIPAMTVYDLNECSVAGVGTVKLRMNKGSNINSTKLKEVLLIHGLSSEETNKVIESATNSWNAEYIEFKGEA